MKKNFEQKLVEQFTDLKVGVPSYTRNMEHLYADFVELIALFSNKSYVTPTDVLDRLIDEGQFEEENEEENDGKAAEVKDRREAWIGEIYKVLEVRSAIFGQNYPFNFLPNRIILREVDQLSKKHLLYIFLLISCNLDLFIKVKSELTSDFEAISYYILRSFLPQHAIVKQFGKNSDYKGTAIDKIRALANDLKIEINEDEISNISGGNNQERGLDVVGWIPFDDSCANLITILGQCACGKEWMSKHHDTRRFKQYLKFFRLQPHHAIFIPYSLIGKGGDKKFYSSDDIEDGTLIFERKRIIDLFGAEKEFDALHSKRIVDKCVEYVEDIV